MSRPSELRVSGTTDPKKLAGAIVKSFDDYEVVEVKAVGASAVNQTIKAMIIANSFLAPSGKRLDIVPSFETKTVSVTDGQERSLTVIDFWVSQRRI